MLSSKHNFQRKKLIYKNNIEHFYFEVCPFEDNIIAVAIGERKIYTK